MIGTTLFLFSIIAPFGILLWYLPAMSNCKRGNAEKILYIALILVLIDAVVMITSLFMLPRV
jgi:hypothetical protein